MAWTDKQQQVIDSRDQNLLVSAAAGSGKTAVMVERIIQIISDENRPVDIDRLLVVTFTNAAAAEMKERIMKSLENQVEKEPGNQYLLRQLARITKAQITTIHSFCLNLIREYISELDIDPGFRIGEEGEISLLLQEALAEVLEEAYEKKDPSFMVFLESYATGKNDKVIEEIVLQAYHFVRSGRDPEQWLKNAKGYYDLSEEEFMDSDWLRYMKKEIDQQLQAVKSRYEELNKWVDSPLIPEKNRLVVKEEYELVKRLVAADSLEECAEIASAWVKKSFPGRAGKAHDKEKSKWFTEYRKKSVELLEKLVNDMIPKNMKQIFRELQESKEAMYGYIDLILAFMERTAKKKRERNLVDFSDLEQMAYQLLCKSYDEEGNPIPTAVAMEKKEFYQEIYVDEYQDTNEVQEEIIKLVSGESIGKHNLFMVGDLKQSIYGFRQAKPELFVNRYHRYQTEPGEHKLIELQNNFRSRKEVLDITNYVFYRLMKADIGGIDYTERTALFPSMDFYEGPEMDASVEMHVLDGADIKDSSLTDVEAEAMMIGQRIQQMVNGEQPQMVTKIEEDGTKTVRKAEYKDIVILLRTVSGWGDVFQKKLDEMGIPSFCESRTGSFTSIEIQTILSILKVLDNARQDIPFAAFLRCPYIGMTGEEMVWMTTETATEKKLCLVEAMMRYIEEGSNEQIRRKAQKAADFLAEFREKKTYVDLSDFIWEILQKTQYYHYAGAMPAGEQRQANLRMLIQKAAVFEGGTYKGLFQFVQYMEQLKEYQIDYGEANIQGEHENLVRIMSIHKSKGLEYPIVIIGGMAKQFNMMDTQKSILMHSDYYLGIDAIALESREKKKTFQKKTIAAKLQDEIIGEELRILYVAMTRAKDKLLMTGVEKKMEEKVLENEQEARHEFHTYDIKKAKSYMDWMWLALYHHKAKEPLAKSYYPNNSLEYDEEYEDELKFFCHTLEDLVKVEVEEYTDAGKKKEELRQYLKEQANEALMEQLKESLQWTYPFLRESKHKLKYSVSEIKKQSAEVFDEERMKDVEETREEAEPLVPEFLKAEKKVSPTSRGTAVHKVMELLDFKEEYEKEGLENLIHTWTLEGKIGQEEEKVIPQSQVLWFLNSSLGKRVKQADFAGNIFKERQFVVGIPLKDLEPGETSEERAIIQGIIDLYFVEDGEIVLVDYKTDRIKRGEEGVLIGHYQAQMKLYKRAIEQMTGMKVKEIYLSSFTLRKNIPVIFE